MINGKTVTAWKPAPLALAPIRPAALGQTTPVEAFLDSSTLALGTDFIAIAASAYVAHDLGQKNNSWSTFFWVVSAMASVKMLHDVAR